MNTIGLIIYLLISQGLRGQEYRHPKNSDPDYLGESSNFMFFSHYWLNMHHFLYNRALSYQKSGIDSAFMDHQWSQFNKHEKELTVSVIQYYSDNIIKEDLRTGNYNYSFKRWVVKYEPDILPDNEQFTEHIMHINKFKNIYDKYNWAEHLESNKSAYDHNIDLVNKYETRFIENLSEICRAEWQQEKIRVDISFNSKRDIPYSTTRPVTHIVMDSKRSVVTDGEWFELLLHEASHHLINSRTGFVGGTIMNAAETLKLKPPRELWHSYLFYFSGKVSQAILVEEGFNDYQMYMVKYGVFGWIFPFLDHQLPAYFNKDISLMEATNRIIKEFNESR